MELNFKAGDKAYLVPYSANGNGWQRARVVTVEKVYANRNVKVTGVSGQFRQSGSKTGDVYTAPYLEAYTEKNHDVYRHAAAAAKQRVEWTKARKVFDGMNMLDQLAVLRKAGLVDTND